MATHLSVATAHGSSIRSGCCGCFAHAQPRHSHAQAAATTMLRSGQRLGLIPFTLDDVLIPGEIRDVFVFEDRFTACLRAAAATPTRCLGAFYFADDGAATEFSSLLRVECVEEFVEGSWARLVCIGRCRLRSVGTAPAGFHMGELELYTDDESSSSDAEPFLERLRCLHACTAAHRRQLLESLAIDFADAPASEFIHVSPHLREAPFGLFDAPEEDDEGLVARLFGDDDDDDDGMSVEEVEHVFVGLDFERPTRFGTTYFNCRDHGELDDEESGHELEQLVAARRAAMLAATAASSLLEAVRDTWKVDSEAAAERELLSFAAVASLGPADRAEGLLMRDTAERLAFAEEALVAQKSQLEALLRMAGEKPQAGAEGE